MQMDDIVPCSGKASSRKLREFVHVDGEGNMLSSRHNRYSEGVVVSNSSLPGRVMVLSFLWPLLGRPGCNSLNMESGSQHGRLQQHADREDIKLIVTVDVSLCVHSYTLYRYLLQRGARVVESCFSVAG
jgi:hypothetical protein